ncbi:hypothetical protein NDU88_000200 [Pleurodeles waltl]|uniref:DDE Tnp4 domain-containing protein n=1 Tax=Pleurodeles waltl TaxID=8319 RepID=A0AAV7S8V6_PLEWA|nr:hypothetical protein NDU88_000200 [Pleurodeles waltl]
MPIKTWQKKSSEVKGLTIGDTGKNHAAMKPELHVFPMIFYVMFHLEDKLLQRRRWFGVVMLTVDVDVVHAGVSVDVPGREVEEEEEGETVEAVDVVVSATVEDLATLKAGIYAVGHIPNIIGVIDGTHTVFVPTRQNEQVFRNRKSFHSMNVQMVCLVDQYLSHINAKYPGLVHDVFVLGNSSIPNVMSQLQRHRVWLLGETGYPNLLLLPTPVKNARTRAEERYDEAHG